MQCQTPAQFGAKRAGQLVRKFPTLIEETTKDGNGRVDVSLEGNDMRIAVEVALTTDTEWEIHNLKKCLNDEYDLIASTSTDKKMLTAITKRLEGVFPKEVQERILVCDPTQFFEYLDKKQAEKESSETLIKGYRVNIEYSSPPIGEMEKKRESIAKVVMDATKKKKPKR